MTPRRAALYLRLSYESREGQADATLERQRADCLELAERRGYRVVAEFTDVDSAWSGKRRAGYEGMLAAADRGDFSVVLVWATDRLYRRMADLVTITDRLAGRVKVESVTGGEVDLSSADGIMLAQMTGSIAEHES